MRITGIDHVVLTVASVEASVDFYSHVLGMDVVTFGRGRTALRLGDQKINLHPADAPIAPHADRPAPGSADLCLVVVGGIDDAAARLADCGVPVELGPVDRAGARAVPSAASTCATPIATSSSSPSTTGPDSPSAAEPGRLGACDSSLAPRATEPF